MRIGYSMEYITSDAIQPDYKVSLYRNYPYVQGETSPSEGHSTGPNIDVKPRGPDTQAEVNLDDLLRTLNINQQIQREDVQEQLHEYLRDNMNNTTMGGSR